jgi:HD-like signal output (HDOD) protein
MSRRKGGAHVAGPGAAVAGCRVYADQGSLRAGPGALSEGSGRLSEGLAVEPDLEGTLAACIAGGDVDLPVLPRAAAEVIALAASPDADSRRLATLVREDPALASAVLRFANSAAMRGAVPVVSMQQAIARTGMAAVRDIALAASMKSTLFASRAHVSVLASLWQRSLATAAWAREIARLRRACVDSAYLSGLLHDIGVAVLAHLVVRLRRGVSDDTLLDIAGRLSVPAGTALARHWRLPETVALVIAGWRDATACDAAVRVVAGAIGCAEWAASAAAEAAGDGAIDALVARPAVARLEFYPDEVARLAGQRMAIEQLLRALA